MMRQFVIHMSGKILPAPMTLLLRDIKHAEGVNDIQIIRCRGEECFAVALGRIVRIYNSMGRHLHILRVEGYVKNIIPHGNKYILLCEGYYFVCTDESMSERMVLDAHFSNIYKILAISDYFVIFHDHSYSLGHFVKNKLVFDRGLTDAAFYKISSASLGRIFALNDVDFYDYDLKTKTVNDDANNNPSATPPNNDDAILILAKTLKNRYLIQYSIQNGVLENTRKMISNGDFIFSYKRHILVIDEQGLWELRNKMVFLKEFGNSKISCIYNDYNRVLVFCLNKEVIEIMIDEHSCCNTRTITTLPIVISRVQRIENVYFCGSKDGWYILSENFDIIKMMSSYGDVRSLRLVDGGIEYDNMGNFSLNDHIPFHKKYGSFRIEKMILSKGVLNDGKSGSKDIHTNTSNSIKPTINKLELAFKTALVNILSYTTFSILNGLLFEHINSCYEFQDMSIFSTSDAIFILSDKLTLIPIRSAIVKYHQGHIYTYFCDKLTIIDLNDIGNKTTITVPINLYDILVDHGLIVLFNGDIVEINLDNDTDVKRLKINFIEYSSTVEYIGQKDSDGIISNDIISDFSIKNCINFLSSLDQKLMTKNDKFFSIGSKIYRLEDGTPKFIYDATSFIHNITHFNDGLIISCVGNSLYYNLIDGNISKFDIESYSSIILSDTICLLTPNGFRLVESFKPDYFIDVSRSIVDGITCSDHNLRLIYKDENNLVFVFKSMDLNTLYMKINDRKPIVYENTIITGHCVVRSLLFCVTLYNTITKGSKLVVFKIKNFKLVVRKEITLGAISLGVCSFRAENRTQPKIAVLTPDTITTYIFKNNKTKVDSVINSRNDYATDAYFMNRKYLAVTSKHWAFKVINTSANKHHKSENEGITRLNRPSDSNKQDVSDEASHATNSCFNDINSSVSDEFEENSPKRIKKFSRNGYCRPFILAGRVGYVIESTKIVWKGIHMEYGEQIAGIIAQKDTLFIFGRNGTISTIRSVDLSVDEKTYLEENFLGLDFNELDDYLINYDSLLKGKKDEAKTTILEKF